MDFLKKSLGRFSAVIVTGGSSGIGLEFLKVLSTILPKALFCNLSRTKPGDCVPGGRLRHLPCDLSDGAELAARGERLLDMLAREGGAGEILLINNSGFGSYGPFPAPRLEHHLEMADVNIKAPVRLTGMLMPLLLERGGTVVNVASTAAFQPTPYLATYGGTKAFLLHWSLALGQDLKRSRVRALAVCPGPTSTRFFERAGFAERPCTGGLSQMPGEVVFESLRALAKAKSMVICGRRNRFLAGFSSLFPKPAQAVLAGWILRKMRLERFQKAPGRSFHE